MTANSDSERRHNVPRKSPPVPVYLKVVVRAEYAPIKYLEWRHAHLSDQVTNRRSIGGQPALGRDFQLH
jgi:hypothetical protein